jgi:hypothetical protein
MRQEVKDASPRIPKVIWKPQKGMLFMLIYRGEKELKRKLFITVPKDLVKKLKEDLAKKINQ